MDTKKKNKKQNNETKKKKKNGTGYGLHITTDNNICYYTSPFSHPLCIANDSYQNH